MFKYLFIIFFLFFNLSVYAADSTLTLKQQLDRLQREVNDISKLVFQNNIRDTENSTKKKETENSMNIAAFDMRIYDLEKDIKTLNSNFEDVIFQIDEIILQIDEIKELFDELSLEIDTTFINQNQNIQTTEISSEQIEENQEANSVEENTLGILKINSEDLSDVVEVEKQEETKNEILELNPDEQFQKAFDLLRSQKFSQAKKALEDFVSKNSDNKLAGSSYYWIGEIHLLRKEYREAALVFAEAYQKYPSSVKAPDILYKLAMSLSQIDKNEDACNTLKKFVKEYSSHKLFDKINSKITELNCE